MDTVNQNTTPPTGSEGWYKKTMKRNRRWQKIVQLGEWHEGKAIVICIKDIHGVIVDQRF